MEKKIYQKLNYTFKKPAFLELALTHRSMRGKNNERLEFLGDSILNFIIANELFNLHPQATEGDLSRLRANLVNRETLAELARKFNLGPYLRLGSGELKSGGFQRDSILADSLEAIIGGIYLDSDIHQCQAVVLEWYKEYLTRIFTGQVKKDAKTQLQEYLQQRKRSLPEYVVLSIEGEDHAQTFHIECHVAGFDYTAKAQANSRRKAEQLAAGKFLNYLETKLKNE